MFIVIGRRKPATWQYLPRYTEAAQTGQIVLCIISKEVDKKKRLRSRPLVIAAQRMWQHDAKTTLSVEIGSMARQAIY
jgi:hypothetical protein